MISVGGGGTVPPVGTTARVCGLTIYTARLNVKNGALIIEINVRDRYRYEDN